MTDITHTFTSHGFNNKEKSGMNRLEQVSGLPAPADESVARSNEEAVEIFREALRKSKGKCNNIHGWYLARHKNATVDDIIKFGVMDNDRYQTSVFKQLSSKRTTPWERQVLQRDRKFVRVRDTFLKKYLESKGLWDEKADREYGNLLTSNLATSHSSSVHQFNRLMAYAKFADLNNPFTEKCPNVIRNWVEHITLEVKPELEFTSKRKELFQKELEWLGKAPEEVLNKLADKELCFTQNFTQAVFNSGLCSIYNNTPGNMEVVELVNAFVEVMEHIGLGIADTQSNHATSMPRIRVGMKSLIKKTINMGKVFVRLVKQGFEPNLARDEVIDQLNQWVQVNNINVKWQFYPLNDAPTHYDYQRKPKEKATGKRTSRAASAADSDGCVEVPGLGKLKVF